MSACQPGKIVTCEHLPSWIGSFPNVLFSKLQNGLNMLKCFSCLQTAKYLPFKISGYCKSIFLWTDHSQKMTRQDNRHKGGRSHTDELSGKHPNNAHRDTLYCDELAYGLGVGMILANPKLIT